MTASQNKIDLIKDCVKVCSAIYHFGFDNIEAIHAHVGLTRSWVQHCLVVTKKEGHTWKDGKRYGLTETGREYVEGLAKNSALDIASQAIRFKDEALSGLVEFKSPISGLRVSGRSAIDRAVLPSGKRQHTSKTPEDFIVEQDRIKKGRANIAKNIGISIEQLEEKFKLGLIAICKGCDRVELFHSHGKYRQDKCIKCRRKNR